MNDNENTNAPIKLPDLLPCPFCGGPGYLCQIPSAAGGDRFIWIAKCSAEEGCGVEFLGCSRKVDAIKEWNTRNAADALRAEVEGYRTEPMIYEVVFTKGKHQGTTIKTIAFNDKSVEDALGDTGYINGIGSLYGNGFTYLPIKPNAGEEGTE